MIGERYMFGKLVEVPGGKVRAGHDYHCTGRSPGFPAALEPDCRPHVVGIGTGDMFRWAEYPWPEGGLVLVPRIVDGRAHLLAARVRARSERGESVPGRFFVQSHYLALDAASFRAADLVRLAGLWADPMTEVRHDLPPLELPERPELAALPAGWLDDAAPLLERLMSGAPVALTEPDASIAEQLRRCAACLSAMPPVLAWRLGVGVGWGVVDGTVALGFGLRVSAPGTRAPTDRGARYVRWLREVAADCTTLAGLAALVASRLERFARHDSVAIDVPWPEVARRVVNALDEEERLLALERWLDDPARREPPRLELEERRADAVRAIVARIEPGTAEVLARVASREWSPAWCEVGGRDAVARALGCLLGTIRIETPNDLLPAKRVELPGSLVEPSVVRLALDARSGGWDAVMWLPLARPIRDEANWVAAWRERASGALLALGALDPASGVIEAIGGTQVGGAWASLCTGGPRPDRAARLVAAALASTGDERRIATALVERAWHASGGDPVATAWLVDAFAARGVEVALPDPDAVTRALWDAIPRRDPPVSPAMVELVLARRRASSRARALDGWLLRELGQPMTYLLLGIGDAARPGPHASVGEASAVRAPVTVVLDRLDGSRAPAALVAKVARAWAASAEPARRSWHEWLRAVLVGRPFPSSAPPPEELATLKSVLEVAASSGECAAALATARSAEALEACLAVLPSGTLARPSRVMVTRVVALATRPDLDELATRIRARRLTEAPGWRVLAALDRRAPARGFELRSDERDAVDALPDSVVVRLALAGVLATRERLAALSLSRLDVRATRADISNLVAAAEAAREAGSPTLAAAAAAVAARDALASGATRDEIDAALEPRAMLSRIAGVLSRRTLDTPLHIVAFAAEKLDERQRAWVRHQLRKGRS